MNDSVSKVSFICDGSACGGVCPNPSCKHTPDPRHAVNFHKVAPGIYFENTAPLYDFELAENHQELMSVLRYINKHGCRLVSVTQNEGVYTVFFGRSTG